MCLCSMCLLRALPLFLLLLSQTVSLQLKKLNVPKILFLGDKATLSCTYDLEGDTLYAVKWYKGDHEFFRYLPATEEPKQIFPTRGVYVQLNESNATKVTLKSVDLTSEGLYRCEVSTEAPNFHTIVHGAKMKVYVLPSSPPTISGVSKRYKVGEPLILNCTSGWSKPRAQIAWYINDETAPKTYLVAFPPDINKVGLKAATLGLHFPLQRRHLRENVRMYLKCVSTVASVYWESSELTIGGRDFTTITVMGSQRIYAGSSSSSCTSVLPLLLCLFTVTLDYVLLPS